MASHSVTANVGNDGRDEGCSVAAELSSPNWQAHPHTLAGHSSLFQNATQLLNNTQLSDHESLLDIDNSVLEGCAVFGRTNILSIVPTCNPDNNVLSAGSLRNQCANNDPQTFRLMVIAPSNHSMRKESSNIDFGGNFVEFQSLARPVENRNVRFPSMRLDSQFDHVQVV